MYVLSTSKSTKLILRADADFDGKQPVSLGTQKLLQNWSEALVQDFTPLICYTASRLSGMHRSLSKLLFQEPLSCPRNLLRVTTTEQLNTVESANFEFDKGHFYAYSPGRTGSQRATCQGAANRATFSTTSLPLASCVSKDFLSMRLLTFDGTVFTRSGH